MTRRLQLMITSFLIVFMMIDCSPLEKNIQELNWDIAAELPPEEGAPASIGYAGPVAGAHNGVLLIGGGANFPDGMPWHGGAKKYHDELWVYKPATNIFQLFRLPHTLAYSANVSTQNGVISIGGENEQGLISEVLMTQWNGREAVVSRLPSLPIAITNAAAAVAGSSLYVAGGETKEAASARFFTMDMNDTAARWKELQSLPQATSHAVLAAVNGSKLFLAGGRKKTPSGISDLYATLYEYDIAANEWKQKKSMPYSLCAGTGTVINDEYIVLFGGDRGETFHKAESVIKQINHETDSSIKARLNEEKIKIQSAHPGFSKEVLWYNIHTDEWTAQGFIPFDVPVTTTAVGMNGKIYLPTGEIKAGVRTPQILQVSY